MIDSNEYWSPKQAVRYIRRLEEQFDLCGSRSRRAAGTTTACAWFRSRCSAAVATGENLNKLADVYPLIANQAVDVINVSDRAVGRHRLAGRSRTWRTRTAYRVSMMNCQANFMAQIAAALPNHTMMEVVDPGPRALPEVRAAASRTATSCLGEAPGFGIEIDEAKLARAASQSADRQGTLSVSAPRGRRAATSCRPQPGEVPWRAELQMQRGSPSRLDVEHLHRARSRLPSRRSASRPRPEGEIRRHRSFDLASVRRTSPSLPSTVTSPWPKTAT